MDFIRRMPLLIWNQILSLRPSFLSKTPHFNFISTHYIWIISIVIIGAILLFTVHNKSNMPFIDAVFFMSAATTQAGLNTYNVNDVAVFGQVVIYLSIGLTNPIVINMAVVFLRLFWFERRFQRIVHEAKRSRMSFSKTRTKSFSRDPSTLERGAVNPESIMVMRDGKAKQMAMIGGVLDEAPSDEASQHALRPSQIPNDSTDENEPLREPELMPTHNPAITFADAVKRDTDNEKLPIRRAENDHIAILNRQRNPDGQEVLRIPNPRDVERGVKPELVAAGGNDPDDEDDENETSRSTAHKGRGEARHAGHHNGVPLHFGPRTAESEWMQGTRAVANTFFTPLNVSNIMSRAHKPQQRAGNEGFAVTRWNTLKSLREAITRDRSSEEPAPYLSWDPDPGRNSQFPDLTDEQRDELGGIEYRSLKALALVLVVYFWTWHIFGIICFVSYILTNDYYGHQVEAFSLGRVWWAIFTSLSSFHNCGLSLMPNSMASFVDSPFVLLISSFLIIAGNTGFPVILRFVIWIMSIIVPRDTPLWEEFRFLLDHPRRCFTLLFPSSTTWWLLVILIVLNGIDLLLFVVLDVTATDVGHLSLGLRFLNGWYMAITTRTAGFSSVSVGLAHPAVLVSWLIMMYISVFPVAISVRRTNVYEEQALGLYPGDINDGNEEVIRQSYVASHLRRQLSFDLWFIFAALFIFACSEAPRLRERDVDFSLFAILFDVVSAYGTVGLSMGYKDSPLSFAGQFSTFGKFVLCVVMIRGRHRGLPYGVDRAIMLPKDLKKSENQAGPVDGGPIARRTTTLDSHATGLNSIRGNANNLRSRATGRQGPSFLSRMMQLGPVASPHIKPTLNRTSSRASQQTTGVRLRRPFSQMTAEQSPNQINSMIPQQHDAVLEPDDQRPPMLASAKTAPVEPSTITMPSASDSHQGTSQLSPLDVQEEPINSRNDPGWDKVEVDKVKP